MRWISLYWMVKGVQENSLFLIVVSAIVWFVGWLFESATETEK